MPSPFLKFRTLLENSHVNEHEHEIIRRKYFRTVALSPIDMAQNVDLDELARLMMARHPVFHVQPPPPVASHKIKEHKSMTPNDWRLFRRNFENAVTTNNWQAPRARRELQAAMAGPAAEATQHIVTNIHPADDFHDVEWAAPVEQMLNQYQRIFIPPQATQLAEAVYSSAKQEEHESILTWHGRLRTLFTNAFPEILPEAAAISRHLIGKFIMDLNNEEVKRDAYKTNPRTYDTALDEALGAEANVLTFSNKLNKQRASGMLGAIGNGECFNCGDMNHLMARCPKPRRNDNRNRSRNSNSFVSKDGQQRAARYRNARPGAKKHVFQKKGINNRGRGGLNAMDNMGGSDSAPEN